MLTHSPVLADHSFTVGYVRALVVANAGYTCNGTAHNRQQRKGRSRMGLKGLIALAAVRDPYADCFVFAPRCQQLAVRAPGHRIYPVTANTIAYVTVSYALSQVTGTGRSVASARYAYNARLFARSCRHLWFRTLVHVPSLLDQICTVLSQLPLAMYSPRSGLQATASTSALPFRECQFHM